MSNIPTNPVKESAPEATREDGRIAGLAVMGACNSGGAEDATESLIRATSDVVAWRAVVEHAAITCPAMLARIEALCPVSLGAPATAGALADPRLELAVAWGVRLSDYRTRARTVYVSHAPPESTWGRDCLAASAGIDRLVAVSPSAYDSIPDEFRPKSVLISNCINFNRLGRTTTREETRMAWGVRPGRVAVGLVSRTSGEKRAHLLADVLANLPPRFVGVLVGGDPTAVHDRAISLRVADRLASQHSRPDVGNVYRSLDYIICTSEYESFWLVGAEAVACGCPVVAPAFGFLAEHPGLARIVHPDPAAIATGVLRDEADPAARDRRADAGRRAIRGLYGPNRFAAEWRSLILDLCRPADVTRHANGAALAVAGHP